MRGELISCGDCADAAFRHLRGKTRNLAPLCPWPLHVRDVVSFNKEAPMRALILFSLAALPLLAQADDTVFRCTTANGKVVQVVQTATHVRYTFGKPGQAPEMTIETPTAELDYSVSSGSQIESFLMNFKNGGTTYLLDASTFHEDPDWNGQLTVLQGDTQLAMLDCRSGTVEFTAGNMAKEPERS
jgi:hypothetical protein